MLPYIDPFVQNERIRVDPPTAPQLSFCALREARCDCRDPDPPGRAIVRYGVDWRLEAHVPSGNLILPVKSGERGKGAWERAVLVSDMLFLAAELIDT